MITISLRMDKKRLAALVLALALAGAGAVCAKQMLWQTCCRRKAPYPPGR